jgi:dihydrolipoamide dehydrogenase
MLVIGGGATGLQVASVFNAFGTNVALFEAKERILSSEDEDFGDTIADGFRARGVTIHTGFGSIDRFEAVSGGIAMHYVKDGKLQTAEATLAVAALGWIAQTDALNLAAANIATDPRGFVQVDAYLRTSSSTIYAAGDVTGQMMLAPQAIHQGIVAASNALSGDQTPAPDNRVAPMGSFTDPEYAQVGLSEGRAREAHDPETVVVPFASATRPIIDGRTDGFCKLIADRASGKILGCHIVGERAVDIVQVAAVAMAADMTVDAFAKIPWAFPTYAGILGRAATMITDRLQRSHEAVTTAQWAY